MKMGYVMSPGRGDVDLVLGRFARALMDRGLPVAGWCRPTPTAARRGPATWM